MSVHPTHSPLAAWRVPVLLALGLLATGLHAQTSAPHPQRPEPLQADAPVPPLRHTSAFARYKAHTEIEVGAWRQANDLTAQIGGWRAYAREAHAPDAPAALPASAAAAASTPAGASSPPKAPPPPHQHGHSHHHHGGQP